MLKVCRLRGDIALPKKARGKYYPIAIGKRVYLQHFGVISLAGRSKICKYGNSPYRWADHFIFNRICAK